MTPEQALRALSEVVLSFSAGLIEPAGCRLCGKGAPHEPWCALQAFRDPLQATMEVLKQLERGRSVFPEFNPEIHVIQQTDEEAVATWAVDQDQADARADGIVAGAYYRALREAGMPEPFAAQMTLMWLANGER